MERRSRPAAFQEVRLFRVLLLASVSRPLQFRYRSGGSGTSTYAWTVWARALGKLRYAIWYLIRGSNKAAGSEGWLGNRRSSGRETEALSQCAIGALRGPRSPPAVELGLKLQNRPRACHGPATCRVSWPRELVTSVWTTKTPASRKLKPRGVGLPLWSTSVAQRWVDAFRA